MISAKRRKCLLIVGAPGSGIDLLKLSLQVLGLNFAGGSLALNEIIRSDLGFSSDAGDALLTGLEEPRAAEKAKEKIRTFLKETFCKKEAKVLGDCLIWRFLPLWLDVLAEMNITPHLVHLIRHPWEVANSLRLREKIDLTVGHSLWLDSYRVIEWTCCKYGHSLVLFDDLYEDPLAACRKIETDQGIIPALRCGDPAFDKIKKLIEPNRRKSKAAQAPRGEGERFSSFARLYNNRVAAESNLVWLSSYPRSGNTMLRIILNHNFGLKSYSIYNDSQDIGSNPALAEVVGHLNMDWSFLGRPPEETGPVDYARLDWLRYTARRPLSVKTHSRYHNGFAPDKVIYIYRDGRSVFSSYASYHYNYTEHARSEGELIEKLLCTQGLGWEVLDNWTRHVGAWHEHAASWLSHPKERLLCLKFEDMTADFEQTITDIGRFLNLEPLRKDMISFQLLNALNPDFFRKGKKKSWPELFDNVRHALFWIINGEAMLKLGYGQDKSPICRILFASGKEQIATGQDREKMDLYLAEMDQVLQDCAEVIAANLDVYTGLSWGEMGVKLEHAYRAFIDFYLTHSLPCHSYQWFYQWEQLLSRARCGDSASRS